MGKMLKIYTIENDKEEKILRQKSLDIPTEKFKNKEFREFLDDLLYTAIHSEEQGNVPAGGISAPQVGVNKNIFYILNYDTNKWELFINPSVEPTGFIKMTTEEGCLSVPNILGNVNRYKNIKVKFQDLDGNWITKKYSDLNAITIQHEKDHLEGILFIDRMDK
ncbi:MAG: peptide deformylase [Candidatus Dojkabacteria bacterium]|nr:peptide deformylase [Candidatus Dojkabacteria bacterium]